jgi:hypothetical protein
VHYLAEVDPYFAKDKDGDKILYNEITQGDGETTTSLATGTTD